MSHQLVIEFDDSVGRYVGHVPTAPGCFAEGDTHQDCSDNLTAALEDWVSHAS